MEYQGLPNFIYPVGTVIEIDGRPHKPPVEHVPGLLSIVDMQTGQPLLVPDGQGGTRYPKQSDYDAMTIDGRIEVILPTNVIASRALMAKAEWDMSDLEAIDPGVRKITAICETLDENGVKNGLKAVETGLKKYWTEELRAKFGDAPKPSTVKKWRMTRGKPGARIPRLMVRLNGKVPRKPHDSDVPLEIRRKHALAAWTGKGKIKVHHGLATTELIEVNEGRSTLYPKPDTPYPIFSYDTFRRDYYKIVGSETVETRDGKRMVESAMRGGGKPLTASRINEKVIIDHTPLDCFLVVDPERDIVAGRPWLTLAIDVHSRAILAWVITFRPPSYWTVCECLRRMNLPKRPPPMDLERYPILARICGKPGELILDNAAEFTGHGLEDAAKSGSFSVRFCPIKQPRYRAIGERAIGTIQRRMLENLPGGTMPIEYTRRTEYDAQDLAVATPNELEALANKAIAEYHVEPHDGLGGLQPALVFQKSANRHGIDVMGDTARWRLETLESKPNVQVTKSGVRIFNGLRYECAVGVPRLINNCLRFEPQRQSSVDASITTKVKYDPENISVIHAWDKTTLSYVKLKCSDETYADGMPLWFHQHLAELAGKAATGKAKPTARKRVKLPTDPAARADAIEKMRQEEQEQDAAAIKGFNTEAERLASRTLRIEAIRKIAPGALHRERITVARLYEIPRLRQLTGNIVHLKTDYAASATTDDFISHDVSALTALDAEILALRPDVEKPKSRTGKADRRDSGKARKATPEQQADQPAVAPSRRRQARG